MLEKELAQRKMMQRVMEEELRGRRKIQSDILNVVLRVGVDVDTLHVSESIFGEAMQGGSKGKVGQSYVLDTMRLYRHPEAANIRREYGMQGIKDIEELNKDLKGAKKIDVEGLNGDFLVHTGLLGQQVMIGVDTSKPGEASVSYYTRNKIIITELYRQGAFGGGYSEKSLRRDLKSLDTRVLTGISREPDEGEKTMPQALGYARIDIGRVERDRVELKIVIRSSYRYDIGRTLKFYPYGMMLNLENQLKRTVGASPVKIMQREPDGVIKTRVVSFTPRAVRVVYKGYKSEMVEKMLNRSEPGWDSIGVSIKGYNLESSLYSRGYSRIRLERIVGIQNIGLTELDRSQHMVNYNNLKAHFQTQMRRWRTDEYLSFRGIDLSKQATNGARQEVLMKWLKDVKDRDLYDMMAAQPELFGDIVSNLDERERNLPKPFKSMEIVELPENYKDAADELREMLDKGVVQISMTTTKSTNVRTEVASTNPVLLRRMLGANYVENYESVGYKIRYLRELVRRGKFSSAEAIQKKVYQMGLGEYIDVSELDMEEYARQYAEVTSSLGEEGEAAEVERYSEALSQAIGVVESGLEKMRHSNRQPNPYHVMIKRVYAETSRDYFATVDIRNVQSVEYAPLKK